jgi:hypothetical protein
VLHCSRSRSRSRSRLIVVKSHLVHTLLHKPCISHERAFKPSEIESVHLRQRWDIGSTAKRACPLYSRTEGVEGLLHVKERFYQIGSRPQFATGAEVFENFEQVLSETVESV